MKLAALLIVCWTGIGVAFAGGARVIADANGGVIGENTAVSIAMFLAGLGVAIAATRVFTRLESKVDETKRKLDRLCEWRDRMEAQTGGRRRDDT